MKNLSQQNIVSTSITPSFNGPTIDSSQLIQISVQAVVSGAAPTGTIKLQASNDVCTAGNNPGIFVPTNWSDVPNATVSYVAAGAVLIPKQDIAHRWVRIVNTFTSGTGTVAASIFAISI